MSGAVPKAHTIAALARALNVSRGTIVNALKHGRLVPTSVTPDGRRLFSHEYVAELVRRAADVRSRGRSSVVTFITRPERPPISAAEWVRQKMWKRKNLPRPASRGRGAPNDRWPSLTADRGRQRA